MKIKLTISVSVIILILTSFAYSNDLKDNLISKTINKTNSFISTIANELTGDLLNNERVKYLELDVQVQENLKPTISLTNVNKLTEDTTSAFFNQNTVSIHDNDQTVNFGLGYRNLLNDDKLMLGANLFFDYSFDNAHQRNGLGIEAISSVFSLRGNYYDATSGIQTVTETTTEEAMDGWDTRFDYHLPLSYNVSVFAGLFEFENSAGTLKVEGEKLGLAGNIGKTNFEAGYIDDNKIGDGAYVNISMVFDLGAPTQLSLPNGALEYVSVRDQLYIPVKRENKIRVAKASAGVQIIVSGF